jgi:hypothetical protein
MAPDGPRAIPGNRCESESWKWWPGSDRFAKRIRTAKLPEGRGSAQADPSPSNQRHADFQDDGEPGSAPASRRRGTGFARADRTALADRAHTEPRARGPTEPRSKLKKRKGLGASRPSGDRTGPPRGPLPANQGDASRSSESCRHRPAQHPSMYRLSAYPGRIVRKENGPGVTGAVRKLT